jgi:hypothetical protein
VTPVSNERAESGGDLLAPQLEGLMRIDIFPTLDDDGAALVTAIRQQLSAASATAQIRVVRSTQPLAVISSVAGADVVILDLTPAEDGRHRYTAMSYPWQQDHVLAVSRRYLPVNVAPRRRGGAAAHPGRLTNQQIASWVRGQLTGPRAVRRRSMVSRAFGALLGGAGSDAAAEAWAGTDIFISYRSAEVEAAYRLRDELAAGRWHDGEPQRGWVPLFASGCRDASADP